MISSFIERLKSAARSIKADIYALYFASRDARTPWYAKWVVAVIVAYALSPIDLIPDFIPIIGYLDDLILLPLGILLAVKLVPNAVMLECKARARESIKNEKTTSFLVTIVIILIWLLLASLTINYLLLSVA
ncbi:YkvA family protein [Pseudomonadota bacterium]|nr:YkvA family protein [Pseudomonadota bacterium]